MAVFSLFWNTKMASVTSCENALYYTDAEFLGAASHAHIYQEITHHFDINVRKFFFLPSVRILQD